MNSDGKSCAFSLQSNSFYFKYSGTTYSITENLTSIYIIPDYTTVADATSSKLVYYFNNLVPEGTINSEFIETAYNFSISGIQNIIFKSKFDREIFDNGMTPFEIPTIKNINFSVSTTKYNVSVSIENLELSSDGMVYFIMQKYLQTVPGDFEGDYFNKTIEVTTTIDGIIFTQIFAERKPTSYQILNCLNYYNKSADVCFRAVVVNGSQLSFDVRNIQPFYVYKVYYFLANENPIKPVYNDTVFEAEVLSYKLEGNRKKFLIILCLILIYLIS